MKYFNGDYALKTIQEIHFPERLKTLLEGETATDYITPLFWLHGESNEVILNLIEQMHSVGVSGFILESRPFPEFLEQSWWETVDFILQEAEKRNLKVFVFDDIKFPSGFAAGRVGERHPEYLKLYLRESHFDVIGPIPGAYFQLNSWLEAEDKVIRVLTVKTSEDGSHFDVVTAEDVTASLNNDNILYWDVPPGRYRIFLFIRTREGGEQHTKNYLNPLNQEAIKAYIDEIYESHFAHFGKYFGKTFDGFFSDEPRFGSAESYSATLGKIPMVLPFSDQLLEHLSMEWGSDLSTMLPCLWYDDGENTVRARSTYMNVVSRLYAENYTCQIGDWCRKHQVKLIGHLVEDNGAHARLGYGSGHFFRAIHGQDWSGVDAVLHQVLPGYTSGKYQSPFGLYDSEFFYWGLAKLASSAGHFEPKKQGTTFCEAFGAYGWQEGLKLMKWLTDHFCVRGVNHFVPHAFSAKNFPDPDCPPHFYAHGHNPQWRYFKTWSDYANRICHLLSGGRHVAPVAIVYHAEAEWTGGEYDPFEKTVKVLMQRQIDCDIVPVDCLLDNGQTKISAGKLCINQENYQIIIVPYAEYLPESFLERLNDFTLHGMRIAFMRDLPARGLTGDKSILSSLLNNPLVTVVEYTQLAEQLLEWNLFDIRATTIENDLQYYHYSRPDEDIYFFINGSTFNTIDTQIIFRQTNRAVGYNPMDNSIYQPIFKQVDNKTTLEICLEPYESTFIIFSGKHNEMSAPLPEAVLRKNVRPCMELKNPCRISIASAEEFPGFKAAPEITGLGNISIPSCLPTFSGTIRYETEFEWQNTSERERIFLDLGEVYETVALSLNGHNAGVCISPPYRLEITECLHKGMNKLQIDVTNTLAKQLGNNRFDCSIPHEPSGLLGPVQILST